jgi:heme exporter protein C
MTTDSAAAALPSGRASVGGILRGGLFVAAATTMAITLYFVFFYAPTDANLGVSQRILYYHVPVAILGLFSIVVVAVASAAHLITKREEWDSLAYSAAEIGVLLTSLGIVTGAMWAKPTWGIWWTWDPKLTLTLVLWFIYVGYLMLRTYGPKGSQGARYGAVVATIGAIDAPIVYYAAELWRTTHPTLVIGPAADSGGMDSRMAMVLLVSMVAFVLLFVYVLVERYALRRSEAAADELYRRTA